MLMQNDTADQAVDQAVLEIKKVMRATGMRPQGFAATLGLSAPYLTAILRGERRPSQEVMERLQLVYGFDPEEMRPTVTPAQETAYIELFKQEVAAGSGIEIDDYSARSHIAVPYSTIAPYKPETIKAMIVRGESMVDERINDGDFVLFNQKESAGQGQSEGIFVVAVGSTLLVKHVVCLPEREEIRLVSANREAADLYPDRVFQGDERDELRVAGRVIACIHRFN
jgi:SOS-response transcriptional repressor LexA